MSIQRKLTLTISLLMFIILSLNVIFSHLNALSVHKANLAQQIDTIANQLTITLKLIEDKNHTLEHEMARSLYGSAKAAEQLLPRDHANITNEQLVNLSNQLNVEGITLWVKDDDGELLSINSSNPSEISLRSKTWDYWNTAMLEIFNLQPVSVTKGENFLHFYSGPLNFTVTDPSKIFKFGYYYTGKTNYMINTMSSTEQLYEKGYIEQQQEIVKSILSHVNGLDEITAFNPEFFGKEKILKMKNGQLVQNLDVRDIIFGDYSFQNGEQDVVAVQTAVNEHKNEFVHFKHKNSHYTRVFIPIDSHSPYVISFVFNNEVMMQKTMQQLIDHIVISILLFILTTIITSFMSRQFVAPVLQIKEKVKHIANQNFNYPLHIKNKDELGVLATHVNEMNTRLQNYTAELMQTASQLEHAEHQLKSIISLSNDPIAMMNLDYKFYNINSAFTHLFGYCLEQLHDVALPELNPEQKTYIYEQLTTIVNNDFTDKCELDLLTINGKRKYISLSLSPIHDINEQCIGLAGIMHDMTAHYEKKQLLIQNEKLSTISQLSATIAHEFRNPLTTLHGFLKLSEQRGHLSAEYIPTLLNELEHMELILGQFLTMAKPQAYMMSKLNIEQLLTDITHLLQSSGKLDHIKIKWKVAQSPCFISGDNKYIRQAFVNIILNSIEAIQTIGEITITIEHLDSFVLIKITDTGKGISAENLTKIFDPFYTNKEFGTGLGLLVTQQIIVAHHGEIHFTSEVNKGTTAAVKLPKFIKS